MVIAIVPLYRLKSFRGDQSKELVHPAGSRMEVHSTLDLVSRLAFRRQLQQAQPEEQRSRDWNELSQFLRQRLSFRRSRLSQESQEVEVALGRKFTRLTVVKLPEYKKVNDTRHLPGVQSVYHVKLE
ncbi:hypothetical protein BDR07DRAFT_1371177 [Suillus spraguei]|nr:hypothetical protein BDR07DRAFT_1371177 [Suillus spraguei]